MSRRTTSAHTPRPWTWPVSWNKVLEPVHPWHTYPVDSRRANARVVNYSSHRLSSVPHWASQQLPEGRAHHDFTQQPGRALDSDSTGLDPSRQRHASALRSRRAGRPPRCANGNQPGSGLWVASVRSAEILLGIGLLRADDDPNDPQVRQAPLVHGADTAAAVVVLKRGELPACGAKLALAASGINVVLAVLLNLFVRRVPLGASSKTDGRVRHFRLWSG